MSKNQNLLLGFLVAFLVMVIGILIYDVMTTLSHGDEPDGFTGQACYPVNNGVWRCDFKDERCYIAWNSGGIAMQCRWDSPN